MEGLTYKLNTNLEQLKKYIAMSPIGYLILDKDGKILAVNEIFLHASQYSESDLVNHYCDKIINFDGSREEFMKKLQSYSPNNHLTLTWQDYLGNAKGSKTFIWKFSDSDIIYFVAFSDIEADKHLDLLSLFAKNFVSDFSFGLIVINKSLNIVEISPLACNLLNISKNEVLNRSIDEVFIGVGEEHRIVQRTLIDGITVTNHAITWVTNDQKYDLLLDSNIIRNEKGDVVGAYVVFKDVTNLRSLEHQVRQNDRLAIIGQVAAGTAHEIRNPLTSIKGFLQFIKDSLAKNGLLQELKYTEVMLSEIDRINKLVNEILLLSKPKDITYKPVEVNKVLKEILLLIHNESLLHNVEVKYSFDQSLPLITADSESLKQVFLNIAKNGIEAMTDGGILTIKTSANIETKFVEIFIHDTGSGIPHYIVDKIFDPFFTTKETGTGLGLSISQKIIHDLGGSIKVSAKGFGTTFKIYLPFK